MQTPVTLGRPADRRKEIVSEIRQQIVGGSMPPGSQLPTRLEIESHFSASPLTVQRALESLREDGFITVNGRQGTYVSQNPPHLTNFVLVFPHSQEFAPWVRFWTALNNQAASLPLARERRLKSVHLNLGATDTAEYEELIEDVVAHRVAGLIFATAPHQLVGTPILDEPGIPRVSIQSVGQKTGYPVVDLNRSAFFTRAFQHLRAQGHKSIACIGPTKGRELGEDMLDEVREIGFATHPYWWQGMAANAPQAARNCAHLLMNPNQKERPDALIISDDNLVEPVMSGLIAAGVSVPKDLEIVAHCNFPWHASSVLPCRRLGFDSREILNTCIGIIDAQRRGEPVPEVTKIDAMFEDEIMQ